MPSDIDGQWGGQAVRVDASLQRVYFKFEPPEAGTSGGGVVEGNWKWGFGENGEDFNGENYFPGLSGSEGYNRAPTIYAKYAALSPGDGIYFEPPNPYGYQQYANGFDQPPTYSFSGPLTKPPANNACNCCEMPVVTIPAFEQRYSDDKRSGFINEIIYPITQGTTLPYFPPSDPTQAESDAAELAWFEAGKPLVSYWSYTLRRVGIWFAEDGGTGWVPDLDPNGNGVTDWTREGDETRDYNWYTDAVGERQSGWADDPSKINGGATDGYYHSYKRSQFTPSNWQSVDLTYTFYLDGAGAPPDAPPHTNGNWLTREIIYNQFGLRSDISSWSIAAPNLGDYDPQIEGETFSPPVPWGNPEGYPDKGAGLPAEGEVMQDASGLDLGGVIWTPTQMVTEQSYAYAYWRDFDTRQDTLSQLGGLDLRLQGFETPDVPPYNEGGGTSWFAEITYSELDYVVTRRRFNARLRSRVPATTYVKAWARGYTRKIFRNGPTGTLEWEDLPPIEWEGGLAVNGCGRVENDIPIGAWLDFDFTDEEQTDLDSAGLIAERAGTPYTYSIARWVKLVGVSFVKGWEPVLLPEPQVYPEIDSGLYIENVEQGFPDPEA